MAMASGLYGATLRDQFDTSALGVDLLGQGAGNMEFQLVSDTHTPDFNTHTSETDITNEVDGGGDYTAGGEPLPATLSLTASTGVLTYDAGDVSLTGTTFATGVRGCIVFDDSVTTPTADPLVMAMTFGADYTTSSGTFAITWSANGLFQIDYTP